MRHLATLTLVAVAFLFGVFSQPAQASIHGSLGGVPCPMGAALGDGCPQNTGGTFNAVASPNLWGAYARANGQTWAAGDHPWTWNAPGIDYRIGPYGTLKDPASDPLPNGCTYDATGTPLNTPRVFCDSVNNLTLAAYDFGKHGCIQLTLGYNLTGVLTITSNRFANGPNCSVIHARVVAQFDSATPTKITVQSTISGAIQVGDTLEGGSIDGAYTITANLGGGQYSISGGRCRDVTPCVTSPMTMYTGKVLGDIVHVNQPQANLNTVVFKNNMFDGDGLNYPLSFNQFVNAGMSNGVVEFDYNVFLRMPTRPVTVNTQGSLVFKYNYFEDFCYNATDGHCEPVYHNVNSGSTQALKQYSYNVFLNGKTNVFPGGTALIWMGTGAADGTDKVTNTQVDHNIIVANCVPNGLNNEGWNTGASACTGNPGNGLVNIASKAVSYQDTVYTNSTNAYNYIDAYGVLSSVRWGTAQTAVNGVKCTTPTVFTGNIELHSGLSINAWDSNVAGSGC